MRRSRGARLAALGVLVLVVGLGALAAWHAGQSFPFTRVSSADLAAANVSVSSPWPWDAAGPIPTATFIPTGYGGRLIGPDESQLVHIKTSKTECTCWVQVYRCSIPSASGPPHAGWDLEILGP